MTERASDAFDAILFGDDIEGDDAEGEGPVVASRDQSGGVRGRAALFVSMACVAAGILLASGAILAAALAGPVSPSSAGFDREPAPSAPSPVPSVAAEPHAEPSQSGQASVSGLVDGGWIDELADRTGMPPRALAAYAGASMRAATESPSCGLGWNTLAGIGFVESEHGTIHGSILGQDGIARPGIIGIPLDGTASIVVRDSDGGALDGDAVWDRAVGPMQFIPETWSQWGADGDGDGTADPQNIDDSALAAARYLCAAGGDLTDSDGWIAAVHAYNPSVDYNNRVADAAAYYAGNG